MSKDLERLESILASGTLARGMARLERERVLWHRALAQSDMIAKQIKEFTRVGSTYSLIADEIIKFRPAISDGQ